MSNVSLLLVARIQAVVYMTRSVHEAENESVVNKAIEYTNVVQQKRTPFRVAPPVIPMCEEDINAESFQDGKFLKFQPSPSMSGCFVAIILREVSYLQRSTLKILEIEKRKVFWIYKLVEFGYFGKINFRHSSMLYYWVIALISWKSL